MHSDSVSSNEKNGWKRRESGMILLTILTLLGGLTIMAANETGDPIQTNKLCKCHDGAVAPYVKSHSSLTTSDNYGNWSIGCFTCHSIHHQEQVRTYGNQSYVYQGITTNITGNTLKETGANWTPNQYMKYWVIANIAERDYRYKITGNTNDTLNVEGPINLEKGGIGDTFAIIYGKVIRDTITTPNSGIKTVQFFDVTGKNSFADGDMTYDGICEVCHTQTTHFRNDGNGSDQNHTNMGGVVGTRCTKCHQHINGFRGMGGGAHETHVTESYGPDLTCSDCHGSNNPPVLADGENLENTTVCNHCHSTDGGLTAKQYWRDPGSSIVAEGSWAFVKGEASFCGSCHDSTPGNTRMNGGGSNATNIMGDMSTYGFSVTGHGKTSENYARLSWQDNSANGNPAANRSCSHCHELTSSHFNNSGKRMKPGYEDDSNNSNCKQCHDPGTVAVGNPGWYTTYTDYQNSAHGNVKCTACHDVHGTAGTFVAMTKESKQNLCYQCHNDPATGGIKNDAISNKRPGGYVSADDIQEAFSLSEKHDLGASFTLNNKDYTLECISCHNVHIVTGRYWDAEAGKSPVTRIINNVEVWGDELGEKMNDFAAQASGSRGWYYSTARGGSIILDQPATYQPPKSGNGHDFEFGGDVLPDYTTFCLDCHSYRMGAANPPINWGQGIACTDNSVDPPDQRIECGADHGLGMAGKPLYISDEGTAGFWGSSGNLDVIFNMNYVTRGRHNGHFMRWPYDSAERSAGINFVLSCTDCHEAHGSNRGGMIRERFNVNANGDCGTGGDSNPNGENCADGGNWNSFCNVCHYYYGGQHAGMSCGSASCHEANSIHRIIHTVDSGSSTQLMLTAADYEANYSKPDFTPEIDTVEGHIGSNELLVTFRPSQYGAGVDGIFTNENLSGALEPKDFWLFDTDTNNPKTIANVSHTAGGYTATITLSAPLVAADLNNDILASRGKSIWAWYEGGYVNYATGIIPEQVVSAGPWPVTITGPPPVEITRVEGIVGTGRIEVTFSEGVYANTDGTGALAPSDFVLTDTDDGRTITNVEHVAGRNVAWLTLSSAMDDTDGIGVDTLAAASNSIYDLYDNPVGTDPSTIAGSDCPIRETIFQLNEPAGSTTVQDTQGVLTGTVGNPVIALPGDGYFHGNETQNTYIDLDNSSTCLLSPGTPGYQREVTIEARVYTPVVDLDTDDINRTSTQQRIIERKRTFQLTIFRGDWMTNWTGPEVPRDGARVIFKYRVPSEYRRYCDGSAPDDDYVGNGAWWKQVTVDRDEFPIVPNHWYKIKVVFDSDRPTIPVNIWADDQGTDGFGTGENWVGYKNIGRSNPWDSGKCQFQSQPGDEMLAENQLTYIGSPPNHNSPVLFKGWIDWVTWKPVADYSGVDDLPH